MSTEPASATPASAQRQIYIGAVTAILLLAASMTAPRWFAGPGGGLEDAAGAALTFIAFATAGVLLAFSLLVRTLLRFGALSWPARIAGIVPTAAAAAIVSYVWSAL